MPLQVCNDYSNGYGNKQVFIDDNVYKGFTCGLNYESEASLENKSDKKPALVNTEIKDLKETFKQKMHTINQDRNNLQMLNDTIQTVDQDLSFIENILANKGNAHDLTNSSIPLFHLEYIQKIARIYSEVTLNNTKPINILIPSRKFDRLKSTYNNSNNIKCLGTLKSLNPCMVLLSNIVQHVSNSIDLYTAVNTWEEYKKTITTNLSGLSLSSIVDAYYAMISEFLFGALNIHSRNIAESLSLKKNYNLAIFWILTTGYIPYIKSYKPKANAQCGSFCKANKTNNKRKVTLRNIVKQTKAQFCQCKLLPHNYKPGRVLNHDECFVYLEPGKSKPSVVFLDDLSAECDIEYVLYDSLCEKILWLNEAVSGCIDSVKSTDRAKPTVMLGRKAADYSKDVIGKEVRRVEDALENIIADKESRIIDSNLKLDKQKETIENLKLELKKLKDDNEQREVSIGLLRQAVQQDSGVSSELLSSIIPLVASNGKDGDSYKQNILDKKFATLANGIQDRLSGIISQQSIGKMDSVIKKINESDRYTGMSACQNDSDHISATDKTYDESEALKMKQMIKQMENMQQMFNNINGVSMSKKLSEIDVHKSQNKGMMLKLEAMTSLMHQINIHVNSFVQRLHQKDTIITEQISQLKQSTKLIEEQQSVLRSLNVLLNTITDYHEEMFKDFQIDNKDNEDFIKEQLDKTKTATNSDDEEPVIKKLYRSIEAKIIGEQEKLMKEIDNYKKKVDDLVTRSSKLHSSNLYDGGHLFQTTENDCNLSSEPKIIDVRPYQGPYDEVIAHNFNNLGQAPYDVLELKKIEELYWESVLIYYFKFQPVTTYSNKTVNCVASHEISDIIVEPLFRIVLGENYRKSSPIDPTITIGRPDSTNPLILDSKRVIDRVIEGSYIKIHYDLIKSLTTEIGKNGGDGGGDPKNGQGNNQHKDIIKPAMTNIDETSIKTII